MQSSFEQRWFRIVSPSVVSEVIDGEAVIMDLRSGHYYSARDSAAMIWGWIEQGQGDLQMIEQLVAQFDVSPAAAQQVVAAFIDELLAHDLVRPGEPGATPAATQAPRERTAFVPPKLAVYTDMQDLLLLDPIHDVDEVGWPTRRDDAAG